MTHQGYSFNLFGKFIPLPVTWLIGRGDAVEFAVDEHHFDMKVEINHFLFGLLYTYYGRFKVL